MSKKRKPQLAAGRGFAWQIQIGGGRWAICHWAYHDRSFLTRETKPSPEAKAVSVAIVPAGVYANLRKLAKAKGEA